MPITYVAYPNAIVVSLRDGIQPATVSETLSVLLNGTDRSLRVLFDIRHVTRMRAEYFGTLVHLNTQLRAAGFPPPIGLWFVDRPNIEFVLVGARLHTIYEFVRSTEQAARFVRVCPPSLARDPR